MASVSATGSPSETSAATLYTHERSEPTLGCSLMSGFTGQKKKRTKVVRAHLEGLVAAHHKAHFARLLVLEEAHICLLYTSDAADE